MRRIRAVNTSPELIVRRLVHSMGFRFRLHAKSLPGRPDLVFPRLRKIILVHGCFWHSHEGCSETHMPKTRRRYWRPKLEGNMRRDLENTTKLEQLGWKILIVWECETPEEGALKKRLKRFLGS
jgi:DNA mismatch endonuclease (patch repair protein)